MACGISFVWLNVFLMIYSHEALQENTATGEINEQTFTATIKAPEGGEAMICVKGGDHVLKCEYFVWTCERHVKNRRAGLKGANGYNF